MMLFSYCNKLFWVKTHIKNYTALISHHTYQNRVLTNTFVIQRELEGYSWFQLKVDFNRDFFIWICIANYTIKSVKTMMLSNNEVQVSEDGIVISSD